MEKINESFIAVTCSGCSKITYLRFEVGGTSNTLEDL